MTELYTRCPHCHTVFKLHTAQLDAAGGKVRCGACLHVFVAKEHLVRPKQAAATAPSASSDAPSERPKPSVANRESMPTPTPAVADRETKAPKPTAVFEARPVSTKPQPAPPIEKPAYAATEKQAAEKTPIVVAPKIENTAPSVAATTASSSNAKVAHRSDH